MIINQIMNLQLTEYYLKSGAKFLGVCLVFLMGCCSQPSGPFNTQDDQDNDCRDSFGGHAGYCDAINHRGPKQ
jgi:hypothetical protein